ncbi:MAG: TIGR03936 family radical SAM-associated protein [Oscillospiraceae bacterium]
MEEVYALKSVRIWFDKFGSARYISYWDLCRCMERVICKAKLPCRYAESLNSHIFLTINIAVAVGHSCLRESMDIDLLEENFPTEEIVERLNAGLPGDIRVTAVTEPVMVPGDVAFFSYEIYLDNQPGLLDTVEDLLRKREMLVVSCPENGNQNEGIKLDCTEMTCKQVDDGRLCFAITLKSSCNGCINPRWYFDVLSKRYGKPLYPEIIRTNCFDENMNEFV